VDHWIQILTETPKEILYAAADAERISAYILCIEEKQKSEMLQAQGARQVKQEIALEERIYLAVPYGERNEAKAIGARWDPVKKAWYVWWIPQSWRNGSFDINRNRLWIRRRNLRRC
jgi:putative DNA primase/helicase